MTSTAAQPSAVEAVFTRVVVGIDGSPESLEAARQAAALAAPDAPLALVSAWQVDPPVVVAMPAVPAYAGDELSARAAAEEALRAASEQLPTARTVVRRGFASHVLLDEIGDAGATLVAVGSHGGGRARGILSGSTATAIVHDARCSVLVARPNEVQHPTRIAVGVDGSPMSARAFEAARHLAARFGAELSVIVAEGDKLLDLAAVSLVVGDGFHVISDEPVPALTRASAEADLLVVGSRGLHGLRSLGSVSERVAHRARCSTLIVR